MFLIVSEGANAYAVGVKTAPDRGGIGSKWLREA